MGLKPRKPLALAGLEEVAWSELETADGPATDLPEALLKLTSRGARTRRTAFDTIENAINHQGWASPAAAAAVPFLVELACDPRVSDRGRLVALLGNLAVGGMHTERLREGDRHDAAAPPEAAFVDTIRAQVAGARDRFVALLEDEDPHVRAAAVFLLAFLGEHARDTAPHVEAHLRRETDPIARASALIAMGMLDQYLERQKNVPSFTAALDARNELERLAGAVALSYVAPLEPTAVRILAEAARGDARAVAGFPWCDGDAADLAARTLRLRGGTSALLDLLLDTPIPGFGTDPTRSIEITCTAEQLLRMVFSRPLGADATPEDLDDDQRRVVTALSRDPHYWPAETTSHLGLPATPEDARAWLGIADPLPPKTILDQPLTLDKKPQSLREWWVAASNDESLAKRLVAAIAAELGAEDGVDLFFHAHCDIPDHEHGPESASMQIRLLSALPDVEPLLRELAANLIENGPPTARRQINGRWTTVLFSRIYGYIGVALALIARARGEKADELTFELVQREMSVMPELAEIREALGAFSPARAATLIIDSGKRSYWTASTHPDVITTVHQWLARFRRREQGEPVVPDFIAALRTAGEREDAERLEHHWQRFLAGESLTFDAKSQRIA